MKTSPEHINLFGKFVVVLSRFNRFFAQRASGITAVNSFHPVLKYTWEISDTSLVFLDIKISIEGNGLCTSVYHKPTDSHSYLWYSSSQPSHVKNFIPFSQFLRLRQLLRVTTLIFRKN